MVDQPVAGSRVIDLVAVMDRLRSPGGCPWDARQTHASLIEYLIEESYEVVEAIDLQDWAALREELGDLLLQVVFHARIATENSEEAFTIDDVADGIIEKLVRRHPHVFADASASSAEAVEADWHVRKAQEKGRESVTEGIPEQLPALMKAGKLLSRSANLSQQLPVLTEQDAAEALMESITSQSQLGDLLLALVAAGRQRGWDAESALRNAVRERAGQIREVEAAMHSSTS